MLRTFARTMKVTRNGIIIFGFFIVLVIAFVAYTYPKLKQPEKLPIIADNLGHKIRPFAFIDQEGDTITNETVNGKIYIAEYFFTTCKGICPRMNENMSKVYEAYRGNDDVLFLSHTVDPIKDTVEAMKSYSLRFDADPDQWHFLTGDKQELYNNARYSYLISASDDTAGISINNDFIHDEHFVLVDRHGKIRGKYYDGTNDEDVAQLIEDIGTLLKEQP